MDLESPTERQPAGNRSELECIAGVRTQYFYLAPRHTSGLHQPVKPVVRRIPCPDGEDCRGQYAASCFNVEGLLVLVLDLERVDRRRFVRVCPGKIEGGNRDHPKSTVLQNGKELGQDQFLVLQVEAKLGPILLSLDRVELDRLRAVLGAHRFELENVLNRSVRRRRGPIFLGERFFVLGSKASRIIRSPALGERLPDFIAPGARERRDNPFEFRFVYFGEPLRFSRHVEVEPGLIPGTQRQVVVEHLATVTANQSRLEFPANVGRETTTGKHHEDGHTAIELILPDRDLHTLCVVTGQDRANVASNLVFRCQEELFLRHRVEDRDDLFVVVGPFGHTSFVQNGLELLPEDRDVLRWLRVGLGGEEP